jgi:hypothetical protein
MSVGMAQLNAKNQLSYFVKRRMEKLGVKFERRCAGYMDRILSHAIERMALARVLDRADKIIQAQENLSEFIDCLCKHAKELRSYPEITERAFDRAKLEKCPSWPLC